MMPGGRGRGMGASMDRGALRRPGEAASPPVQDVNALIASVAVLDLQQCSSTTMQNFQDLLNEVCTTGDILKNFVHRLHHNSLQSRRFGIQAAIACGAASTFEIDGVKMRNLILGAIQKDYEEYTQLQTANKTRFLNSVALLGEVFYRIRINGSPIAVLVSPVMHYLGLLLGGEEHEMELFTTLLSVNGNTLMECSQEDTEELLLRVRSTLMSRNLSGQCRCWLLLALDLASNRFTPLSNALKGFYQVHLGSDALLQLQRIDAQFKDASGSSVNHTQIKSEQDVLAKPCMKAPPATSKMSKSIASPSPALYSNNHSSSAKPSEGNTDINRSLYYEKQHFEEHSKNWRGDSGSWLKVKSGSNNTRKMSTEKSGGNVTFITMNSNNKEGWGTEAIQKREIEEKRGTDDRRNKSQGWGHDDRFEKEENFYGKQEPRENRNKHGKNKEFCKTEIHDDFSQVKLGSDNGHANKAAVTNCNDILQTPPQEENWD